EVRGHLQVWSPGAPLLPEYLLAGLARPGCNVYARWRIWRSQTPSRQAAGATGVAFVLSREAVGGAPTAAGARSRPPRERRRSRDASAPRSGVRQATARR